MIPLIGNWTKGFALDRHTGPRPSAPGYLRTKTGEQVCRLKYDNNFDTLPALANEMASAAESFPQFDVIVSAPHSKERVRQPVAELATAIGEKMGKQVDLAFLRKVKNTGPMKDMEKAEKLEALKDAFDVDIRYEGKSVLVVDDIFDDGVTLTTITKTLQERGKVNSVYVLTATRTGWY